MKDLLPGFMKEGTIVAYVFGFDEEISGVGNTAVTARKMSATKLKNGEFIYIPKLTDSAYSDGLIFNPYFRSHITIGKQQFIKITE